MASFRDQDGRDWVVDIRVGEIKRVRSILKIDLTKLFEDGMKQLGELLSDPVRVVEVLYVICEKQCKELGIKGEDFGESFGGDTLGFATDAFLEALIDFFPNAAARESMAKVIATHKQLGRILSERAGPILDELDPNVMVDALISRLRALLTAAPPSSDSTPTPSPSES